MSVRCLIKDRKCCMCGKRFVFNEGWAYKKTSGARVKLFCSWSCMRKWEKTHRSMMERREAVQVALGSGMSVDEVAEKLKEDRSMVAYWNRRMQKDADEVPQQEDDS